VILVMNNNAIVFQIALSKNGRIFNIIHNFYMKNNNIMHKSLGTAIAYGCHDDEFSFMTS